jgi:hypothetical protein
MGDIAQRGNKLTAKSKEHRAGAGSRYPRASHFGGGRTRLLEELGRVEAEPSNRNRRAEIARVHGELNRGYKIGGRVKKFGGGRTNLLEELGRVEAEPSNRNRRAEISRVHGELNRGYAVGGAVRRLAQGLRGRKGKRKDFKTHGKDVPTMAAEGGRIGLKKGGSDKKWMQKVSASIKKRGTKGKCTPITKKGCTGRAKALAKTFKKIAAKRKAKG